MISSIVWLVLLYLGKIDPEHAPWAIYLPIVFVEVLIYFKILFKTDEIIKWFKKTVLLKICS